MAALPSKISQPKNLNSVKEFCKIIANILTVRQYIVNDKKHNFKLPGMSEKKNCSENLHISNCSKCCHSNCVRAIVENLAPNSGFLCNSSDNQLCVKISKFSFGSLCSKFGEDQLIIEGARDYFDCTDFNVIRALTYRHTHTHPLTHIRMHART